MPIWQDLMFSSAFDSSFDNDSAGEFSNYCNKIEESDEDECFEQYKDDKYADYEKQLDKMRQSVKGMPIYRSITVDYDIFINTFQASSPVIFPTLLASIHRIRS